MSKSLVIKLAAKVVIVVALMGAVRSGQTALADDAWDNSCRAWYAVLWTGTIERWMGRDVRVMRGMVSTLAVLGGTLLATVIAPAQMLDWTPEQPRPLEQVALLLQSRYEKLVTYEDPIWRWTGDSAPRGTDPDGPLGRWLKDRFMRSPSGVIANEGEMLDTALVQRLVDAYHQQNPGDVRFKVLQSSLGFHIVPALVHDESGVLVQGSSLLDTIITILPASRMPSEHLDAICDAVAKLSGVKVINGGQWVDSFFAPKGLIPPRYAAKLLSSTSKEPYSFIWGAYGVSARAALIDLLESSATTLSWALLCHPTARLENAQCVLNVVPLQVVETRPDGTRVRESLTYDRCGKCEFLNRAAPR